MFTTIDKEQTNFIKGLAILIIILHNYFHQVSPNPGENEFFFNPQALESFFSIISTSFLRIINALLSFLGHYGVQLFVFISGYGLSKSFMIKSISYFEFIKKRVYKIYPSFFIGILLLFLYDVFVLSDFPGVDWLIKILYKILMIHTLIPEEALSLNGPWWFYGLIMQLYFLFIPLYYVIKKWKWKGFVLILTISYVLILLLYKPLLENRFIIMANAPGHIPEFVLGIFIALNPNFKIKIMYLPVLIGVFVLGNLYFSFFPFTFIIVTYFLVIGILKLYQMLVSFKKDLFFTNFIKFYGTISMFLFATHGFFRWPYFVPHANDANNPLKTIAIGLLYLLLVTVVAVICQETYGYITKKCWRRVQ